MPIVVKHEPNAGAVLGLSQMAGEGAFRKWKTEFEARQKQYAFQNLMSGMSAGQSLAAPFINIAGQKAQRQFQAEQAGLGRQFTAEQNRLGQMNQQERDRTQFSQKMEFAEQFGPIAQMEQKTGEQTVQNAKEIKGLVPLAQAMYGEGGSLSLLPNGTRRYSDQVLQQMAGSGDPTALRGIVKHGQQSMQSLTQAQLQLDPDLIEEKIRAQVDGQRLLKELQHKDSMKLHNQIVGDPNNPFISLNPQTGQYESPDPEFARVANEHLRKIKARRLGVSEMPFSAQLSESTQQITPWDWWTRDANGNVKIQSITGGPNGRARRTGGTGKSPRYPGPYDPDWTPEQIHDWEEESGKLEDKIYQDSLPSDVETQTWVSRLGDHTEEIRRLRTKRDDADNPKDRAKWEARIKEEQQDLAATRAGSPKGKSREQSRYEANLRMFRAYNVNPPRLGFGNPNFDPRGGGLKPFGVNPLRRSRTQAGTEEFLGRPAGEEWQTAMPGLKQGATNRDVLQKLMTPRAQGGFGLNQTQARQQFQAMEARREETRRPTPPDYLRHPGEMPSDQPYRKTEAEPAPPELLDKDRPTGAAPGTVPEPSSTGQGFKQTAYPPVEGWLGGLSKVAGPNLPNVAFSYLKKTQGVNDQAEINSILRNPEYGQDLINWVHAGKSVESWPHLRKLYLREELDEAGRAVRSPTGRPTFPSPAGPVMGARAARSRTASKSEQAAHRAFAARRKMAAGIIQSAVKFSVLASKFSGQGLAKVGLRVANIPAPREVEFDRLVREGHLKPGDVIIAPPSERSFAQFMIVTPGMILDSMKKPTPGE